MAALYVTAILALGAVLIWRMFRPYRGWLDIGLITGAWAAMGFLGGLAEGGLGKAFGLAVTGGIAGTIFYLLGADRQSDSSRDAGKPDEPEGNSGP